MDNFGSTHANVFLRCVRLRKKQPFIKELTAWQEQWYAQSPYMRVGGKKLEPITTRALMFPGAPLKHIFKGHAPLGKRSDVLRRSATTKHEMRTGTGADQNRIEPQP